MTRYRRDPLDRIAVRTDTPRVTHVATTSASTTTASVTVARPAGTQTGDLMVASISTNGAVAPGAVSASGWTVAQSQANVLNRTTILWRYAAAGDPANFTFTSQGLLPNASTGAISTYRATAGSSPIATSAGGVAVTSTSHPVPAVTTNSDAVHLVHATGFSGTVTPTPASGTTARASVAAGASLLVADRSQADPGPSTPASVTTGGLNTSASVTVAIRAVTTVRHLVYDGHSDSPQLTTTTGGGVVDFTIPLVGEALLTWNATDGYGFTHTNTHGDAVTITGVSGNRVWTGLTGPYGEQASGTLPSNTGMGGTRWGWHGSDGRLTDRTIVQLGARPYHPTHGRFLRVDPVEGGCANDYVYVYGDPVNTSDLAGKDWWNPFSWTACGVAKNAGKAGRALGFGAAVVGGGALVVGSGGTLALALAIGATGASAVQWGAGAAAGDRSQARSGMLGTTLGLLTLGSWGAVTKGLYGPGQALSSRLVAGAGLYSGLTRLAVTEAANSKSRSDKC